MPKISTRVTFRKPRAVALIKASSNAALSDTGNQALQDAGMYVPKDQGALKNSGINNSNTKAKDGKFTMKWAEPYSKYLWNGEVMYGNPTSRTYGPEKLKFTDALARMEWAKYAREVHGEEWKKVYQAAVRRRLRQ